MNREEAIRHIEQLYPADSGFLETRVIGNKLLKLARSQVLDWRNEPTEVLIRYAELCIKEDSENQGSEWTQKN